MLHTDTRPPKQIITSTSRQLKRGIARGGKRHSYKTYVYAQPKPGNDHYASDFESKFCNSGLAFRVTNSLDWVPQVPFTLEFPGDINTPNPLSALANPRLATIFAMLKTAC
jgi:hypothetical protein